MSQRQIVAGVGILFCTITFILLAVYGSTRSSCIRISGNDVSVCNAANYGYLGSGAGCFGIQAEIVEYDSSSNSGFTINAICPWSTGSEILGCFGVIVGIAFLASVVFLDAKPYVWVAGLMSTSSLFLAVIVMIIDMAVGRTYFNDQITFSDDENENLSITTTIVGFAFTIVLAFLSFLATGLSTLAAQKTAVDDSVPEAKAQFQA